MGRDDMEEIGDSLAKAVNLIVAEIVDHPDDVSVNPVVTSSRLLLELHTNTQDVGQVIGSRGSVIQAIRKLVGASSGKNSLMIDLDFITEVRNRM